MSQPANSSAEVHAFPRRHGFNAFEQAKQELAAFRILIVRNWLLPIRFCVRVSVSI